MNGNLFKSSAEVPQPRRTLETPNLIILPTTSLIPHEIADSQRSSPLVTNLQAEGVLKNPPVVAVLDPEKGTYIVLDGANRVTAFNELGIQHSLVQVVPYEAPYVELQTWYHVVSGPSIAELENTLKQLPDLHVDDANILHARAELARRAILAYCVFSNGHVITLAGGGLDLQERTELLHHIVNAYLNRGRLERTNTDNLDQLQATYPHMTAAIIFPQYEPVEVLDITQNGLKLPPGLSRHIIHGRALRINYPLSRLTSQQPLAQKNADLQSWIQKSFAQRHVRFYAEATFLFDE